MAKKQSLAEWMSKTKPRQPSKCSVCRNKELANAIVEFHKARESGRTTVSWAQFRRDFLVPNGLDVAYDTLQHHVRKCVRDEPR
jgi:hypothetical protein